MWTRLTALGVLASAVSAQAGGMESGGGDMVAVEFVSTGYRIFSLLDADPGLSKELMPGLDLAQLQRALDSTRVTTEEHLVLDGAERDAINHPQAMHIEVNRSRWLDSRAADAAWTTRAGLVAHEYFGILGLSDQNYQLSNQILRILPPEAAVRKQDPSVIRCVPRPGGRSEASVGDRPLEGFHLESLEFFNMDRHFAWVKTTQTEPSRGRETFTNTILRNGDVYAQNFTSLSPAGDYTVEATLYGNAPVGSVVTAAGGYVVIRDEGLHGDFRIYQELDCSVQR